jgi:GTP pyrophosphokinase
MEFWGEDTLLGEYSGRGVQTEPGCYSDVTRTLSDQHVNILNASVSASKDRVAISRFTFEMADASHLDAVLKSVRNIEGVYDVYRVTNN